LAVPTNLDVLASCEPVYEDMDGWLEPSKGLKRFDELPIQAKAYLRRLEDLLKVRIRYISTGSKRDETIVLPES